MSDSLWRKLVSDTNDKLQLELVYIFRGNKTVNEEWITRAVKVKGILIRIEFICVDLEGGRINTVIEI